MTSDEPGMTSDIWADLGEAAERRAFGWECLARGLSEPDPYLLDARYLEAFDLAISWLDRDEEKFVTSQQVLTDFLTSPNGRDPDQRLLALQAEYSRLFTSAEPALPSLLESSYLDTEAALTASAAGPLLPVTEFYSAAGFVSDSRNLPPDHLSVECDFMRFLCQSEAGTWRRAEAEAAKDFRRQEHQFLYQHISLWLPSLCTRLQAAARSKFYWGLAEFARQYLTIETGVGYQVEL